MAETFPERFKAVRLSKISESGRPMSQEAAARLFHVSLSCLRGWEHMPPKHWPDQRNRDAIKTNWPEVFDRQV